VCLHIAYKLQFLQFDELLVDIGSAVTVVKLLLRGSRSSGFIIVLPTPYRLQEPFHIHAFRLHLDHPWVLHHPPRRGSSMWFFLQTNSKISNLNSRYSEEIIALTSTQ
jgi:hypothetical protein